MLLFKNWKNFLMNNELCKSSLHHRFAHSFQTFDPPEHRWTLTWPIQHGKNLDTSRFGRTYPNFWSSFWSQLSTNYSDYWTHHLTQFLNGLERFAASSHDQGKPVKKNHRTSRFWAIKPLKRPDIFFSLEQRVRFLPGGHGILYVGMRNLTLKLKENE